ncbi:MAG: PIN domain-containing protein [Actinobacteria bacterium]|nr:PIN domain-containing protein [Actinomycetota bacterium]
MAGKKKVFLDASIFIAAAGSASGGSSLILEVCRGLHFSAVVTRRILLEARRNIRRKLSSEALLRFYKEIANLDPDIIKPPTEERLNQYNDIIALKDRHVLASALEGKAAFLITLDRKHFQTEAIRKANLPITIMTPKEFLELIKKYKDFKKKEP